jgi:hypothetical protein
MFKTDFPDRALKGCLFTVCTAGWLLQLGVSGAAAQNDAQSSAPTKTLSGGAQVVVLTLNDLRDVGVDLDHLRTAASHLYDETTMQRVTLQTRPSLVGPGTVINIPVGTTPTGEYIQPRPRRVGAAMAAIRPIATLLKTDMDSFLTEEKQLEVPGVTQDELQSVMKQWSKSVDNIYGQLQLLEPLTEHPPYNQGAISQATWAIVEDAKELERLRRIMHKALQREGKLRARKNSKEK